MDNSIPLTYVPYIGDDNIADVVDGDTGLSQKFLVSLGDAGGANPGVPYFIQKNAHGDEGNALNGGGSVSSYTSESPTGRAGNMITSFDLISEGTNTNEESLNLLVLVRIPSGLEGLLGPQYNLSNQPPAESFDYSKWLPRTEAKGCLSFYGGAQASTSGLTPPTGRFPTIPSLPMFDEGDACPLLYLPPGFYGSVNTILNGLIDPEAGGLPIDASGFNITIDTSDVSALYGMLLVAVSFAGGTFEEGTGKACIDFSHSIAN